MNMQNNAYRTHPGFVMLVIGVIAVTAAGQPAKRSKHWSLAEGVPPSLQAVIDAQDNKAVVQTAVARASEQLRDQQQVLNELRANNADASRIGNMKKQIVDTKAWIEGLKKGTRIAWPRYDVDSVKVGTIGVMSSYEQFYRVKQVINGTTALLQSTGGPLFIVEQVNTAGWTDGMELWNGPWPLLFKGTKTYKAVLGTNTVFVAQPIHESDFVYQK